MVETQQQEAAPEKTLKVACVGITARQAFTVYPVGRPAYYAEFKPGESTEVPEAVAHEFVRQEPQRFQIVDEPVAAVPAAAAPSSAPEPQEGAGKGGFKRGKNKR